MTGAPRLSGQSARAANLRGAGLMSVSTLAYALNDTALKSIGMSIPLAQVLFLRGVAMTVLILLAIRWIGPIRFRLPLREWRLIGLRSFADIGATYFFVKALYHMPLANITAILQALPLTVALAAALFLREPLGWRRLLAILIGFSGVMLIIRPGAAGFDIWTLWALGAVGFITLRDLATRPLSPSTPSATVAFAATIVLMVTAGIDMLSDPWAPVGAGAVGLIALTSVFMVVGFMATVAMMRVGEIGFVSPFRYTGLLWALCLGFVMFGDWPDRLTFIGAGIVVATGLFTLYREQKLSREAGEASAPRKG